MNPTGMVPVCKVALPLMGRSCHLKNFRDAWANVFSAKSCREIKNKFPSPRLCTCFPLQKKLTDPSSDENLWFKIPIPAVRYGPGLQIEEFASTAYIFSSISSGNQIASTTFGHV